MSHIFDRPFVLTRRESQFVRPGGPTMESGVLVLRFSFGSASVLTAGISAGAMEKPPTRPYEGLYPKVQDFSISVLISAFY
jgi:hypothetical protein